MTKAAELAKMGEVLNNSQIGGRRNIIINGAMQVAQRGTSTTGTGYLLDRYNIAFDQVGITTTQQSLTSGDPYNDGFRNFIRLANTSTTTNTAAYAQFKQIIEAQDIAKSGWQYTSSSSNISISFWVRSSLAGTYYVGLRSKDTAEYIRNVGFTLLADTWTKVSTSVSGNSNLVFNDDNGAGLDVLFVPYYGTGYTGGEEVSTTDWYSRSSQADAYFPNYAQNWANTSSATFDVTGIQLEVGSQATPFEHRSFGEELALCQRYFYKFVNGNSQSVMTASAILANYIQGSISFPVTMRSAPTFESSDGTNHFQIYSATSGAASFDAFGAQQQHINGITLLKNGTSITAGQSAIVYTNSSSAFLNFDSEL